jgi:anti-sigma factor RsiW
MKCLRFDLRRMLPLYLHGELSAGRVRALEDHLLDCGECRSRLSKLKTGHRMALHLPSLGPQRDPWLGLERLIEHGEPPSSGSAGEGRGRGIPFWRALLIKPAVSVTALAVAALMFVLLLRTGPVTRVNGGLIAADSVDLREFDPVSIADMERSFKPHVVAEGYVSEVVNNDEDGDLSFKLVDDLDRAGPFIICEIIDPIKLSAPEVGSRVRVYGVSRYDGQENHNWYEVHPVLNIEVLRQ